jgi:hypothetical protein
MNAILMSRVDRPLLFSILKQGPLEEGVKLKAKES